MYFTTCTLKKDNPYRPDKGPSQEYPSKQPRDGTKKQLQQMQSK